MTCYSLDAGQLGEMIGMVSSCFDLLGKCVPNWKTNDVVDLSFFPKSSILPNQSTAMS